MSSPTLTVTASLFAAFVMAALATCPVAFAQEGPGQADFTITVQTTGPPLYDGPVGWILFTNSTHGRHYAWQTDLPDDFTVGDIVIPRGLFDVARPQQVMPYMDAGPKHYPLFNAFPYPDVWSATSPAQVHHIVDDPDADHWILRLGFRGPIAGTLDIHRDITAPTLEIGEVTNITHRSFMQVTRTNELSFVELQIRPDGSDDDAWIRHPTPAYAIKQTFPIQGLEADTTYETRFITRDWSNNTATTDIDLLTTASDPAGDPPTFVVLQPQPNATLAPGTLVTIQAAVVPGDAPVDPVTIRMFYDLSPVPFDSLHISGTTITYPLGGAPPDGEHVISIEARGMDGAHGYRQWRFAVGEADDAQAPGPGMLPLLVAMLAAAMLARRRA